MTPLYIASRRREAPRPACCRPPGAYRSHEEIERLMRAFEDTSLPREQWTHAAHLTVALWYLVHYPIDEATRRIRNGILRYNAAHGIRTTRDSGYHETITLFWIRMVRRYLESRRETITLAALANGLLRECADQNLMLTYYRRETIFSWEARTRWVEPDLMPFDPTEE